MIFFNALREQIINSNIDFLLLLSIKIERLFRHDSNTYWNTIFITSSLSIWIENIKSISPYGQRSISSSSTANLPMPWYWKICNWLYQLRNQATYVYVPLYIYITDPVGINWKMKLREWTNTTNMHSGYTRTGIILAVVQASPAKQLKHKIPFHQAWTNRSALIWATMTLISKSINKFTYCVTKPTQQHAKCKPLYLLVLSPVGSVSDFTKLTPLILLCLAC